MIKELKIQTAALHGDLESVRKFLSGASVVNSRDEDERTALHWACSAKTKDDSLVKLLLDNKADPLLMDDQEYTPLCIAAATGNVAACKTLLPFYQGKIDVANYLGNTPLISAASKGHAEVVDLLLDSGSVVDTRNKAGHSALHRAAAKGFVEVVEILIVKGKASINAIDKGFPALLPNTCTAERKTPLMHACESSQTEMAIRLVDVYQASLDPLDKDGNSALDLLATPSMRQYVQEHIVKESSS